MSVNTLTLRGFQFFQAGIILCACTGPESHHQLSPLRSFHQPNVIDLGLRLSDVKAMKLQSESVEFSQKIDPGYKLRDYDVTEKEIAFLVDAGGSSGAWTGKRVELNAMTSDQFISWLEKKLQEHGVKKVVPSMKTLAMAWQRADRVSRIQDVIDDIDEEIESEETIPVPKDLGAQVRKILKQKPELSWDQALVRIAKKKKTIVETQFTQCRIFG